jgi:hypothetical protein
MYIKEVQHSPRPDLRIINLRTHFEVHVETKSPKDLLKDSPEC